MRAAWLTGIPRNSVTLGEPSTAGGNAGLAEAGSLQLEWFTLSARTRNQVYRKKALRVFDSIHKANPDQVLDRRLARSIVPPAAWHSNGARGRRWHACPVHLHCCRCISNWCIEQNGRPMLHLWLTHCGTVCVMGMCVFTLAGPDPDDPQTGDSDG